MAPTEDTPLLSGSSKPSSGVSTIATTDNSQKLSRMSFRRIIPTSKNATNTTSTDTPRAKRQSARGADFMNSYDDDDDDRQQEMLLALSGESRRAAVEPVDGLSPLSITGSITTTDGYTTHPRPVSTVKSLPAFAPFRRTARHRSFYLWWINEFRHWWKSSRLLVRLAGLFTLALTGLFLQRMLSVTPYYALPHLNKKWSHKQKKHVLKLFYKQMRKNTRQAVKVVKKLGQGGPMRFFLQYVHPFTRSLRLLVGIWRWTEAAQCRRGEVGTEEAFAFMGNRVSRMLSRLLVDSVVACIVMPLAYDIFRIEFFLDKQGTDEDWWHPIALFVTFGILRAVAPFAASFQGSRAGRVLTRSFFKAWKHRWRPIQSVERLNLTSSDACEPDEVSQTADLAKMGRLVAKAFGNAADIGYDGMEGQREALEREGFHQVGAGSGGYAVYVCQRRVWTIEEGPEQKKGADEVMTILLHVTPYGPSILDVMPRYIVLEFEDSVDRRDKWSEFISKQVFQGPPVLEGYCYGGAFFSPHHFAELKETYDKQWLAYERGCKAICKPRTGRNPNPPVDLASLKAFLAEGKLGRKRRKNERERRELQRAVQDLARELKEMMSNKRTCNAPRGVILYFEGLDCAGKSSTGGLVEQALRDAGYEVGMCQYNKPPTAAERARPWMDRFEVPKSSKSPKVGVPNGDADEVDDTEDEETKKLLQHCSDHKHSALVWDRGPAGDFVYNPVYRAMPMHDRENRHKEFMEFDKHCFERNILFLKLLFVTNRDSIASTLGKRLAQKKMARDLRTWNQASRGELSDLGHGGFEGLAEIENHIDPTDFIAFNSYQTNLRIFTNFARHTDLPQNKWIVVNTSDRYSARKQLLKAFRHKLNNFRPMRWWSRTAGETSEPTFGSRPIAISEEDQVDPGYDKGLPVQLLMALAGLLLLAFYYCEHTTFKNPFSDTLIKIEDLLPKDENSTPDSFSSPENEREITEWLYSFVKPGLASP